MLGYSGHNQWWNTTWDNETVYIDGTSVNATCDYGYQVELGLVDQEVICENGTWSSVECYAACVELPPPAGENMLEPIYTFNGIGANITYICNDTFTTIVNETFPETLPETIVECSADSVWVPKGPLTCTPMCLDDPPNASLPLKYNWDGINREVGFAVEYSCEPNYLLSTLNLSRNISCEESRNWTATEPGELSCIPGVLDPPPSPSPASIAASILESPPYLGGGNLTYVCDGDKLSPNGTNSTQITFNVSGWSSIDPEFVCYNVSYTLPVINVTEGLLGTVAGPAPPYFVSSTVNYTCPEGTMSTDGETVTLIPFTPDGWAPLDPSFVCLEGTFMPPVLPAAAFMGGYLIGAVPPFPMGSVLEYTCSEGYLSVKRDGTPTADSSTFLTYQEDGWTDLDPDFNCVIEMRDHGPVLESIVVSATKKCKIFVALDLISNLP
ncbi:hypothetical protein SK128_012688 [Halocaridina rubra]|uniref:Sushi domain-containing protein n=1 Tax=Halocaridina rubra TaxID=373956 RepID=A0AAN9AA87_HALRR